MRSLNQALAWLAAASMSLAACSSAGDDGLAGGDPPASSSVSTAAGSTTTDPGPQPEPASTSEPAGATEPSPTTAPSAAMQQLPPASTDVEPGRYSTEELGFDLTFELPAVTRGVWRYYRPEHGMLRFGTDLTGTEAFDIARIGSFFAAGEYDNPEMRGLGSIDPNDIDASLRALGAIVHDSEDIEVDGHVVKVRRFRLDPEADSAKPVCANVRPGEGGAPPCTYWYSGSAERTNEQQRPFFILRSREVTAYLIEMGDAEPVLVSGSTSLADPAAWFESVLTPLVMSMEFGATPAGDHTTSAADGSMTADEATAIAVRIVDAFDTGDLSFIDSAMGDDGTWVGIQGNQIEGRGASAYLRPLLTGIDRTDILGNATEVADGWAFPLREFRGASQLDYGIVIGNNADGGTRVQEVWSIPPPAHALPSRATPTPGVHRATFTVNGVDEQLRIFVPSSAAGTVLPTVINWHASGDDEAAEANVTGYEDLAAAEGFIVVHPRRSTPAYDSTAAWRTDIDAMEAADLDFVDALLDELVGSWCADPARIYSTGYSLGSLFTSRLVCERSDRIAAAVSVAGVFHTDDCDPDRAVPYAAFHGTADPVLPYDDPDMAIYGGDQEFLAQQPRAEFEEFVGAAGCSSPPVDTQPSPSVIRHAYRCGDGTDRLFYEITGGGHTWPGSTTSNEQYAGLTIGPVTDEIDATAASWDFLRHFHLDDA
jgi:polyhydroxybutyrate depolymerase